MGRCKNCIHSKNQEYWGRSDVGLLTCDHPKIQLGYRAKADDIPADSVLIENDEGWGWVVGPEFGCIHFEQE